jgi:hypothetical protein
VFLLRGQDVAAPYAVIEWAYRAKAMGASKEIVEAALSQASKMRLWQQSGKSKVPDL